MDTLVLGYARTILGVRNSTVVQGVRQQLPNAHVRHLLRISNLHAELRVRRRVLWASPYGDITPQ